MILVEDCYVQLLYSNTMFASVHVQQKEKYGQCIVKLQVGKCTFDLFFLDEFTFTQARCIKQNGTSKN